MKKNIIITAIAALLLSASCTQQDDFLPVSETKTFTATIEQVQTKTTLVNATKVDWCVDDEIYINDVPFKAVPVKTGVAEFIPVKEGDKLGDGPYRAVYPATLVDLERGGLCLPSSQTYVPGRLNAPMQAISETEELSFRNICGVICLSLTGVDEIGRISISTKDTPLWGPIEVNPETAVAKIVTDEVFKSGQTKSSVNQNAIGLILGRNGVKLSKETPTNFYIHLPEMSLKPENLCIAIGGKTGQVYKLIATKAVEVKRNQIYTLNINVPAFGGGEDEPAVEMPVVLPGKFTVDGNGKQVQFSCGNLQATKDKTTSGWTWGFAPQQYSYIGVKNTYNDDFASTIDLFGWSSTAKDSNYGIFTATQSAMGGAEYFDGNSTFNDWANNVKLGGRNWRTLSDTEWSYLLNRVATGEATSAGYSALKANVNGTYGLLLLPDGFSEHESYGDCKTILNKCEGTPTSAFPNEGLSVAEWEMLQSAGCVFLPCAGYRKGTSITTGEGSYWSSTSERALDITATGMTVLTKDNYYGRSVRLVTEVTSSEEGDNNE